MFKALFLGALFVTLAVNIIFLLATRDKPPDLITTTTTSGTPTSGRRLVLRSNDFYDYGPTGRVRQSANISNDTTATRETSEAWPHSNETRAIGSQRIGDNATQSVDWKDNSRATISGEGEGDDDDEEEEASNQVDDNEITTSNVNGGRELRIGVKSSRSHVLVSVDNLIIYESGAESLFSSEERKQQRARKQQRRKRKRRRRHELRNSPWTVNESYSETTSDNDNNNNTEANQNANLDAPSGSDESTRGIHVLVLSQFDGSLMAARSFDTYSSHQDSELVYFLNQLQPGRLLVFAIKDEGSFKLPARCEARRLLARLGSRQIAQLGWRDMWALVTRSRPLELATSARVGELRVEQSSWRALAEAINHSASFTSWAEPVHLEARVQLVESSNQFDCFARQPRRQNFCQHVEGYGRVCDCQHPSPVDFRPRPLANSHLAGVPLVVIASNRPYYLYRMLSSLLSADGVNRSQVTVFIDGFYREPAQVCELFNLRYIQHAPTGERSARISSHYKTSLATTFEQLFPEASYAIIFEEDLDVARDALVYFNATMELLERDPSLYCASAWNDQGYEHSAGDAGRIYRVETMPGLGWMLSRELFVRELRDSWPSAQRQHDWDMWIRTAQVRRGRECLIPDVSRTFHFGATGTNINAYFQRQYFSKHAFSDSLSGQAAAATSGRFRDLDKLEASSYERELERVLREEAQFIDYNVDELANSNATLAKQLRREFVCSLANTTGDWLNKVDDDDDDDDHQDNQIVQRANSRVPSNKTNVIFINMIDSDDFSVWLRLAKCWHLWDLDARGQHKSAWRLHLPARHSSQLEPTLVVGVPASPYARFKPSHLVPFDL